MSITVDASGGAETISDLRARDVREADLDGGLDAAGFAVAYARHRDALYRFCRSRVSDPALVEDIVQDVFEKAFARRSQFKPGHDVWPWLASIAVRVCIDAHRRAVSSEARNDQYGRDTYREPADITSATVMRAVEQRRLGQHIAALPPRQRAALGLFALDGWSYDQIARHFGYSTKAVKALIRRARATLRDTADRWVGAALGALRAARARLQHRMARVQTAVWPSFEALGSSAAGILSTASAAVLVLAVATGVLAPTDSHAVPSAHLGPAVPASAAVPGHEAAGGDAPSQPRPIPRSDQSQAPEPPAASLGGEAERAGNELVASILPGSAGADDPESVHTQNFATSPDYEHDPTIFLAGDIAGRVEGASVPLLVTHDGGASWHRLRAVGLAPVTRLLLPPAYPRDRRLFAVTAKGLQVSHDGGDTFATVVTLPQITDATISPTFHAGDPTMLLVAGQRLWQYNDDTGLVRPVDLRGGPATHAVVSVAYAAGASDDSAIVLGSSLPNVVVGDPGLHVSRCSMSVGALALAAPELRCDSVKLPPLPGGEVPLRLSPNFRAGLVYVPNQLRPLVSLDGGRSFRPARQPWDTSDYTYRIHDLAALPSSSGESAIVAQWTMKSVNGWPVHGPQLARTDDGGQTWTSMSVNLPDFLWARSVTVTPTGRIIAASGMGGIGCSEDGGRTWARTCPTPEAA